MPSSKRNDDGGPEAASLRSRFRGSWRPWILGTALAVLAGFLLFDRGLLRHRDLRARIESLKIRRAAAQAEIAFYKGRNQRLEAGDSLSLEAEARRLGMTREGERVYWIELPEDTIRKARQ